MILRAARCFWLASVMVAACAHTEPQVVPPHVNLSPEEVVLGEPSPAVRGVSLGLDVTVNESDSLEDLEALPGVRVVAADAGGPAALAGVRVGDTILAVDGVTVNDPAALAAVLESVAMPRELVLEVRRDTVVFEAHTMAVRRAGSGVAPHEMYRVDPVRTRAGYRTRLVDRGPERRVVAVIERFFPQSPLPAAGLGPGEAVSAVDGEAIASAQDLVRRLIEDYQAGDRVTLTVLGDDARDVRLTLWAAPRRLAQLTALPLFRYENDREPSRTEFSLLGFGVFSLFSYSRDRGEREYRFLYFFRLGTGEGELIEASEVERGEDWNEEETR